MVNKSIVLIPHYNNPEGLYESLSSLTENVDAVVVDDGSTVKFKEVQAYEKYTGKGNLYFIQLRKNLGIESALNKGLEFILQRGSYEYVARLDCGDRNVNDRIRRQESFLDKNSDIYLIGSYVRFYDVKGKFLYNVKPPTEHKKIKKKMFLNCMFIHPSVMFRVAAVKNIGLYPKDYKAAEDYAYFFKFVKEYKTANIPEYLVDIEANPSGISVNKRKVQVANRIRLEWKYFYVGFYPLYGLLRSVVLYILPIKLISEIKKRLSNEKD